MEVFPDRGFKPWRAIPRTMCFTLASGCSADLLMSLSFIRRTRDQSVLDVLEEDCRLTFCCLSKGNDVDAVLCLGMNDGYWNAPKEPERYETLLIHKVQSVVLQVPLALPSAHVNRIRQVYIQHVYTSRCPNWLPSSSGRNRTYGAALFAFVSSVSQRSSFSMRSRSISAARACWARSVSAGWR
jgi:hypothetical protein